MIETPFGQNQSRKSTVRTMSWLIASSTGSATGSRLTAPRIPRSTLFLVSETGMFSLQTDLALMIRILSHAITSQRFTTRGLDCSIQPFLLPLPPPPPPISLLCIPWLQIKQNASGWKSNQILPHTVSLSRILFPIACRLYPLTHYFGSRRMRLYRIVLHGISLTTLPALFRVMYISVSWFQCCRIGGNVKREWVLFSWVIFLQRILMIVFYIMIIVTVTWFKWVESMRMSSFHSIMGTGERVWVWSVRYQNINTHPPPPL